MSEDGDDMVQVDSLRKMQEEQDLIRAEEAERLRVEAAKLAED